MAMHARPLPTDPYNPTNSEGETIRYPSPYIPIRLPVFTLVVWLNDILVRVISLVGVIGGRPRSSFNASERERDMDSVESAEEGEAVPLEAFSAPVPSSTKTGTRIRVSRGARVGDRSSRKVD